MSEPRKGESRHDDVVHRDREVFGPSADLLVRELSRRLPLDRRESFLQLIENWRFDENNRPRDPDLLFARLVELLETLGPTPAGSSGRRRRRRRRRRHSGSNGTAGLVGFLLGALAGLPTGFLAYLVARETVMPATWREADATLGVFLMLVALPAAVIGAMQGASPSRMGHALAVGMVAFLLGSLAFGTIAAGAAVLIVEAMGLPEDDVPLALDLGFGLVPVAAMLGGGAVGLLMGRRAWLRWSTWRGPAAR